ncbi:TadE family type IV pilus minor pilin [Arthrobacter castelli]|uniref:TadE family type IV pilus minor pilin n=1 Tax=Arthrobacter castelli TaxID=271431 RepID=UPI0003F941FA|nr:TadE family type IV pilus minor pilin [Arthrobacter castelli]
MRKHRTSQVGSVTAELAVTLPALTAILALLLVGAVVGVTQLRLEEAARAGARAAARGEPATVVVSTAQRIAGPGADVDVAESGRWARVRVSGTVEGPLADLVSWPLVADAAAKRETSWSAPGGSTPGGSIPPDEVAPPGESISSNVAAAQLRPQGPAGPLRGNTS